MKKRILAEFIKLCIYSLLTMVLIFLLEKHYEHVGNQFMLDNTIRIYHDRKNYKSLFRKLFNDQNLEECPLYSSQLSNQDF